MTNFTADGTTLMRQAHMTAHDYMLNAIHNIDERLGKGYAKTHPDLVAAYMQTAALDLGAAVIARAIETAAETIAAEFQPDLSNYPPEYFHGLKPEKNCG